MFLFCFGGGVELRPFWAYRARVSQRRGAGPWLCVARAAAGSWTEHGVAPAHQVLSLWRTEPYGAVCVNLLLAVAMLHAAYG